MKKTIFVALVGLCCLWPSGAYAESGFIDWLDSLSGPGPFHMKGRAYDQQLWCLPKGAGKGDTAARQLWNCFVDDDEKIQAVFRLSASSASTGRQQLFKDDPKDVRDVHEMRISAVMMYRANSVLDVGGGVNFLHFSSDEGAAFSFWRVGLTPIRVSLTPFGALKPTKPRLKGLPRLIHLEFEDTLLQGIRGTDFNNFTTTFSSDKEFQARVSLLFDAAPLLRAIHP